MSLKAKIGIAVGAVVLALPVISFYLQVLHAYVQGVVMDTLQQLIAAHS